MNFIWIRIVRVRVADAVGADTLRDPAIGAVVLRPILHVVVAWIVDRAILSLAFISGMSDKTLR